jgi:hypothetical protein
MIDMATEKLQADECACGVTVCQESLSLLMNERYIQACSITKVCAYMLAADCIFS